MPTKHITQPLERGNIYFFYRPRVDTKKVEGVEDLQRMYIVLSPHGKRVYRLLAVPKKRLPNIAEAQSTFFSYVDRVVKNPVDLREEFHELEYETKSLGKRVRPAMRPAGEGVYVISQHDDHTHLVYALELPEEISIVQREMNIETEGNMIIAVKNPEVDSPADIDFPEEDEAEYPAELQKNFEERRFIMIKPVDFLDYEGSQLLLIAASPGEIRYLKANLQPQKETEARAEIFNDLRLLKSEHPTKPLFEGEWA